MTIVLDVLLIAIIVFCIWQGYKRGLVPGALGIAVVVIAFYVGSLLAVTYSSEFTAMFKPFVSGYVETNISDAKNEVVDEQYSIYSVEDILELDPQAAENITVATYVKMGIYEGSAEKLWGQVEAYKEKANCSLSEAISVVMADSIAYLLILCVAFILIVIIFTVIANVTNLAFRLPGKETLDCVAGASFGLIRGLTFAFTIAWVLGYLGIFLSWETVKKTVLLEFLMTHNPISAIFGM